MLDSDSLTRRDWLTQAGMVRGYLRENMTPADYAWLRITHTFDENDLVTFLRWADYAFDLIKQSDKIRDSIKGEPLILRKLVKKALLPRHQLRLPVPPEGIRYKTLENWASEVRRACELETRRVRQTALRLIDRRGEWVEQE